MKKTLLILSLNLLLANCSSSNNISNEDIAQSDILSTKQQSNQGSSIPANLPSLPTNPLFATFNNAYQILAEDNAKTGHADPQNNDKYFTKVVLSAQKTLDCAFFDIEEDEIVDSMILMKKKGVLVRVVTDTDNLKDKVDPNQPRPAIEKLKKAGIPIVDDQRQPFMHHKFMVIDNKAVWSGSTNPTTRGMFEHNSNSVYIQSTQLAQNFTDEFKRMFEKHDFGDSRNSRPVTNPIVKVGDATIRTYFSPLGGTKDAIVAQIKNAKKSIKFMAFSFTDEEMAQAMLERKKAGIRVEGVYDECLNGQYSTFDALKGGGISVWTDGNQALMHSKTMIIDDNVVINGSFNFSKNAEMNNNEDDLIISSNYLAGLFNGEYARVKNAALTHHNIPPYDHPACTHGEPTGRNKNSLFSTSPFPSFDYERE